MLLAKQPHSIIPQNKPKRTVKMCPNVLGRSTDNSTEHGSMSLGSDTHVNSMDDDTELVCFAYAVHIQFQDFLCADVRCGFAKPLLVNTLGPEKFKQG